VARVLKHPQAAKDSHRRTRYCS